MRTLLLSLLIISSPFTILAETHIPEGDVVGVWTPDGAAGAADGEKKLWLPPGQD